MQEYIYKNKKVLLCVMTLLLIMPLAMATENNTTYHHSSKHKHRESVYQNAWCSAHNGIAEYINKDNTRVDCLTDTYAVEFDFAKKWAESIGQALHYQLMTNKKAKVVLIIEHPEYEMKYYNRVKALADIYNFSVEYVTEDILNNNTDCNYVQIKNKN